MIAKLWLSQVRALVYSKDMVGSAARFEYTAPETAQQIEYNESRIEEARRILKRQRSVIPTVWTKQSILLSSLRVKRKKSVKTACQFVVI